jgi:hypothetical protein
VTKIFRKSQSALLATCAAASLLMAAPAWAINDDGRGSFYESLLDMVGMGEKSDPPPIAYRERSPLVVPPKMELPAPQQPASQRVATWPTDQEVARARKKQIESNARIRSQNVETNGGEILSPQEMRDMRNPSKTSAYDRRDAPCSMDHSDVNFCSPTEYWARLSATTVKKDELERQAGMEPEREYLTQPPKGYRKATQNVKATFEPVKKDEEDPRDFFLEQARKKAD